MTYETWNTASERDQLLDIHRSSATPDCKCLAPSSRQSLTLNPLLRQTLQMSPMPLDDARTSPCLPFPMSSADDVQKRRAPDPALAISTETHCRLKRALGIGQAKTNQDFAHHLSHKLSATIGNPTIVHRPNLGHRPGVLLRKNEEGPDQVLSNQVDSHQDSTAPPSLKCSGSISTGCYSTGKTSLESNPASPLLVTQYEASEPFGEAVVTSFPAGRENTLSPIQEAPLHMPTILTVETAANAKIFFETYYDPLLAGNTSPRSLRRRELESSLDAQAMPEERRQLERRALRDYESDYLRQVRTLKCRTSWTTYKSGIAIAGFEVVRILGKGSFGVVRLVREKTPDLTSAVTLIPTIQQQTSHIEIDRPTINANKGLTQTVRQRVSPPGNPTKPDCQVFAMKVIRKSEMLKNCQEGHLRAERDFLVASEKSRWVVPLIASFQDNTNLYLVMEYMIGGDFLGLLFRRNVLKERHARWYIAEMVLCIEETHRRKWIHRDIKPDNFLISSSGHLKISDFGLAFDGHWSHDQQFYKNHRKFLMDKLGVKVKGDREDQEEEFKENPRSNLATILTGRTFHPYKSVQVDGPCEDESILQWRNREGKRRMAVSVVGTSQYMAPEVIRGDPYDGRCDWWSIGIILYEVGAINDHQRFEVI